MKKTWIILIAAVILFFVVIQFFRPAKNDAPAGSMKDIVFQVGIPANVKSKLVGACYDCHSNKTTYPFYNRVAPASWIIAKDIREGKEKLNFSEWANYDRETQIKLLTDICDEVTTREMPLKSYVFMHSKAVINEKELKEICTWTEQASEQVMGQKK